MFPAAIRISITCILAFALSGCLSLGSLNYKQVRMLKKEGFVLTDEGWSLGLPEQLLFDFDQASIKPQQLPELKRLAQKLQHYDLNTLKIIGHSDNVGDAAYNLKLSRQRAQSVSQVFLQQHFQKQQLVVIGRGEKQPLYDNRSAANRALNRRVSIVIVP